MRNRSMNTACLCLALALCPGAARGDLAPVSVDAVSVPLASSTEGGVALQWGVIDFGGGISWHEGLVLSGSIADPGEEPFAVLRGFDSPQPVENDPPIGDLGDTRFNEFSLAPISPNPNRGNARVSWTLPSQSRLRLTVHDVQGREIAVLADGLFPPGRHDMAWGAVGRERVSAGIYFVRLDTPGHVLVQRMVVIP